MYGQHVEGDHQGTEDVSQKRHKNMMMETKESKKINKTGTLLVGIRI